MNKVYKAVRFPAIAYENLLRKKIKMEEVIKKITMKNIKIPLTKVIIAISENPIELPDDYLINLTKIKRRRIIN